MSLRLRSTEHGLDRSFRNASIRGEENHGWALTLGAIVASYSYISTLVSRPMAESDQQSQAISTDSLSRGELNVGKQEETQKPQKLQELRTDMNGLLASHGISYQIPIQRHALNTPDGVYEQEAVFGSIFQFVKVQCCLAHVAFGRLSSAKRYLEVLSQARVVIRMSDLDTTILVSLGMRSCRT